ncbi:MAG: hypothetical protein MJ249_04490 [Kiritimatiellae bacterium]|nr:hypothetical protein [Kiritimatiellia bacterium]
MDTTIRQMSVALVSLAAVLAAQQGKAEGEISYDAVTVRGRIENAVLSDDGKWFASKTTGAKIGDTEYAGWVGNTDNLNAQFSSDCLKDVASLAFFKNKLYVALNNKTNGLLRIDVGNGQLPNLKTAKFIKFDPNGTTAMQAPYLYATTNNLYALDPKTSTGYSLQEKDNQSFKLGTEVRGSGGGINIIKDIVSKDINGEDSLYILTTNWMNSIKIYHRNSTIIKIVTGPYTMTDMNLLMNYNIDYRGQYDNSTSIAIHGDKLLVTNANPDQFGFMTQINSDGTLGRSETFIHSDTRRTSAIGSDGQNYYAEAIDEQDPNEPLKETPKYFIKGTPKTANDFFMEGNNDVVYHDRSAKHTGEPAFKILVTGEGVQKKVIAVAPDRLYRLNGDGR